MVKYREILRLTYLGISQENIAFSCGCARSTVQLIQKLAKSKGLEWPLPGEMDDAAIRAVLYPPKEPRDDGKFAIDHEWIEREMGKPGVTMTLLWSEYCVKATDHGADPFMYSAFCQRHRKWAQRNRITLHIDRRPAEEMQVDWAGKCPAYCDPDTGEIRKAHVFVACLPYSSMIFAWPYPNMGEESWIDGHIRAFREFGGTTPIVVPDNCKTGVIKNTVEELVVNEQYRLMCEHYGVAVVPARVRRPKDKAAVEMSVGVVERKVIAAMRDRVFIGIAELAAAIDEAVDSINSAPFQKRAGSRREAFLGREKDRLQPLPPTHYEMTVRKTTTRCQPPTCGARWASSPLERRWPSSATGSASPCTGARHLPPAPMSQIPPICPTPTGNGRRGAGTGSAAGRRGRGRPSSPSWTGYSSRARSSSRPTAQRGRFSALPTSTGTRSWKGRAQRRSPGRRAPATRQ